MNTYQMALEALTEMLEYAGIIEERWDCIATNKARAAQSALEAELAQGVEPLLMMSSVHNTEAVFNDQPQSTGFTAHFYTAPQEPVNAWIAVGDGLPDIDTPVMAMVGLTTLNMYPMMRGDAGDNEWLWEAHRSGPIDDPQSYEADDDYEVVAWVPLPKKPGTTT